MAKHPRYIGHAKALANHFQKRGDLKYKYHADREEFVLMIPGESTKVMTAEEAQEYLAKKLIAELRLKNKVDQEPPK